MQEPEKLLAEPSPSPLPPPQKPYAAYGVTAPPFANAPPPFTPLELASGTVPVGMAGLGYSYSPDIADGPLYQPLIWAGWAGPVTSGDVPGGEFAVSAGAGTQANASTTWTIDYGDGSPRQVATAPAPNCALNPPSVWRENLPAVPNYRYALPGIYPVSVTVALTGCDGTPGPSSTASFNYPWLANGEGRLDAVSEVHIDVPSATWSPPYGVVVPPGNVIEAPSPGQPDYQVLPLYAYCQAPASEPAGATFTITCSAVSADSTTPIQFSCLDLVDALDAYEPGPCSAPFDQDPVVPTAGTMYGGPAATAVVHITVTMPADFVGTDFQFVVTQGPSLTYADAPVLTAA